MKVLGTYQELCTDYYDLHKPVLPAEEWQFYLRYAQEAKGPILEPMCGTGHFLVPLLQAGFHIEGFDASEAMLARLQQRCTREKLHACVWFGFLQDLSITDRYTLAFIPVGSFNLIADLDAVTTSLRALYCCLRPEGRLVLELMTPYLAQHLPVRQWIDADYLRPDGKTILVKTWYESMVQQVVQVKRRYALVDAQGHTEQLEIEEYALRFYAPDEMRQLLQEAGFTKNRVVKAFSHDTLPAPKDAMVVYECQK